MMTARTILTALIVFAFTPQTLLASQTVYKGTNAKGNTVFSDQPFPNSEAIKVAPVQTYSAPPVPTTSQVENAEQAPVSYDVSIVEPQNEHLYTHDIQSIPVSISVAPQLQPNASIVVMLNNQPYGTYDNAAGITLDNLARGQYQLQINVVSKSDNKILSQSQSVTFFQQRISRITNGAK